MSSHCNVAAESPKTVRGTEGRGAHCSIREAPLVALVGRPNSGKSSLYNAITGGDAHVGNFPGVTVDILESDVRLRDARRATIADLPGLYSLGAAFDPSTDEGVARAFIEAQERGSRPFLLAQVLDGTQLALGLRLTRELVERDVPLLLLITQRDVLDREGRTVDVQELERALGVRALLVSARETTTRGRVLDALSELLSGDTIAPAGRDWAPDDVCGRVLSDAPPAESTTRRRDFTTRVDAWLLHPMLGPAVFLAIMAAIFAGVFLIADPVTSALDAATGWLGGLITRRLGAGPVASFLTDGVLGGAGTVLAFMPQIVVLTVALELLEASGYLSRGAFLVDRLLKLLGLSGRSFFPLLMAHACAVPAISATRIVRDPKERLAAILVLPLMTCSARLPTYALLLGTFFGHRSALLRSLIFVLLYVAGLLSGLLASLILRRTVARGRSLPMVMEMPAYRTPELRLVARKGTRAAWHFLRYVGTTIVVVAMVLWALLKVPMPGTHAAPHADGAAEVAPIERSIAAGVGRALEPVTAPIGFDWRVNVGLIASFGARELMVGTMGVIFGLEDSADDPAPLAAQLRDRKRADGTPLYTTRTALALLAFFVIACQCMSTVAAIRRETRSLRWPAFVVAYTYALGYLAALIVYRGAGLFGIP